MIAQTWKQKFSAQFLELWHEHFVYYNFEGKKWNFYCCILSQEWSAYFLVLCLLCVFGRLFLSSVDVVKENLDQSLHGLPLSVHIWYPSPVSKMDLFQ